MKAKVVRHCRVVKVEPCGFLKKSPPSFGRVVFFQKTLTDAFSSLSNGFLFSFFLVFFFLLLEMCHAEIGKTKKATELAAFNFGIVWV
jgi:hypothetical protein